MKQMIVGFTTEGPSDERFLESIVERTFEEIAFECEQDVEVFPAVLLPKRKGEFVLRYEETLREAFQQGIMVLCIHVDADGSDHTNVMRSRFDPLFAKLVTGTGDDNCAIVVPIIPVQMTEAWMLADIELLKEELGTNMNDQDLGLHRRPETIADPKDVIRNAIRIALEGRGRRHRHQLEVGQLYQIIGRKVQLSKLRQLSSYQLFEDAVRAAYRQLNYLQ